MSLLSLSSFTPTELRDSDLSDGYTIVLPKSITPSLSKSKISAQFSAHLDKAKQKLSEGGFKIGWDDELDREPKSKDDERERKGEERKEPGRRRSRSKSGERKKKRRSGSKDTLSSLSDGPELDLSSYTRNLKRQVKPRSPTHARPPLKARSSRPVIPTRDRRSRSSSVTSSSDEVVGSTSESEVQAERVHESRTRAPPPMAYIPHGRTDVLPALPLDPHSAFLAAYRLTHLAQPTSPSTSHSPQQPTSELPLHLVPTFTPSEKRARRLALLLDAEDRSIRDWAMEEYVKLSSSGRTLVSEGVFAIPSSRPQSPSPSTAPDEPDIEMSDFEDASVSEAGGPAYRKLKSQRTKDEDGKRGAELEALAKRLEGAREMAEEREELERERAWAKETFGRWMKDGRADGVFKEAASVLDGLLRYMAREDGEEWALGDGDGVKGDDMTSVRPDESASVADYGMPVIEGTVAESERAPTSGMETQITMKRVEPVVAVPTATPAAAAKPSPAKPTQAVPTPSRLPVPKSKPETPKPAPPATTNALPAEPSKPELKRGASKDETARLERDKEKAPELKRSTSKRDEGAVKRPNGTAPELKRTDSSSRPQIKRADSGQKKTVPTPPAPAPIPKPVPLAPKTPLKPHPPPQSTAQTTSQESQESGTSTIAAPPPKPNFIPTTSSPAVPAPSQAQYESYADFYDRDPRRARDERPIRPHPAYAMGGPNVRPEDVFGSYEEFYKGRSVVGSTVSRRSGGKDKRKEKEKDKRREEKDRARTKEREKSKSKAVEDSHEYEPPHSILIRTQSPSLPRRSSKNKKPFSPSPEEYDPLEDIAVSSRISLETGRLTTPGQSRAASPDGGAGESGERRTRRRRKSSAGLTTPPQSRGPSPTRKPSPPPPPPKSNKPTTSKNTNTKKSGKATRLRGGAPSPSPPPIRRFGPIVAAQQPPPPSEATQGPLIPLESEAGTYTGDAAGEAGFPALGPLPAIQFWMPPLPSSSQPPHHPSEDEDEDFPSKGSPTPKSVFLALGARRACVPYTPAFSGLDMRVVRPVSARERLALRDAGAVLVRLGARVKVSGGEEEGGMGMWSLSYVGL
ncbi:hypothetical protein PENSPDRAFT_658679 [Peniophora sp. CONT]|nr:hypothetical protein PENSPDRAFT_658679 [Peniophora sp. CONT]